MKRIILIVFVLLFSGIVTVPFSAHQAQAFWFFHPTPKPKPTPKPTQKPKPTPKPTQKPADCTEIENELETCSENLDACLDDLSACEAQPNNVFPGDGYPNPDTSGVSGHGPALSYTDNLDGTFTDDNTGDMWEIKLKADGSEGGDCDEANQANRSVHCVNNVYKLTTTAGSGIADGTAFTVFLAELNDVGGGGANCFAGHCDWCIPNIKRLQGIVDYSTFSPASSIPGETAANIYWSSTIRSGWASIDWYVNFDTGEVRNTEMFTSMGVRAVRPCE